MALIIPGPINEGTEDILAKDRKWKWGVEQKTGLGVTVDVLSFLLAGSVGKYIIKESIAKEIGVDITTALFGHVFAGSLSKIVNIRFDRYILKGADGKKYYHVYASYYNLDGSLINAKLVHYGIAI